MSWIKHGLEGLNRDLYVYDIAYHVTLVGVQDHHSEAAPDVNNFSVSNSVRSYQTVCVLDCTY